MKGTVFVYVLIAIMLGFGLVGIPEMCSRVFGAPGKGTGITITNSEVGPETLPTWSYTVTELYPSGKSAPFTASFTLSTEGNDLWSATGLKAGKYNITRGPEVYFFGYPPEIAISSTSNPSYIATGFSVIINLSPSEFKSLDFRNTALPAFSIRGLSESPPSDLSYNIPVLQPIPIQSTWDVDINNNGQIDLVAGKLTTILVNVTGTSLSAGSPVSIVFEGSTYTQGVSADTSIVAFKSIVPSKITSSEAITGSCATGDLTTTYVTVKNTTDLPLYYVPLTKSDYGSVADPALMSEMSSYFVNATYPIKNLNTGLASTALTGASKGTSRSPYSGILADAMAAAQQAQLYKGGSAVGIAIGPISATTDYFAYHGFPGAAGISFGPSVKGVVVLDGYYTAPAHEIAHTFGLYYGVPEEYVVYPPQGKTASGVSSVDGTWRTGYDFMGIAPYKTTDFTWVTDTTYEDIFKQTSINPADPEILLVSGIVYTNGTVEANTPSLPWYHLENGIPDTLTSGSYSLDFIAHGEKLINRTSFNLQFSVDFCPGIGVGKAVDNSNFENRTADCAGFSFAAEFFKGAYKVQIMNNTGPGPSEIMATVYVSDMRDEPVITNGLSGTEAYWFTSDVVPTMFAVVVLPMTCTRLIWVILRRRLANGAHANMKTALAKF